MAKRDAGDGGKRLHDMLSQELPLWAEGCVVAGLDEVGAGPIAGPVTAACVVLEPTRVHALEGVDDSKALSPRRREELSWRIEAEARAVAIADASVEEVDRLNILQAARLAMSRALASVVDRVGDIHYLLVDARTVPGTEIPQVALVKGDSLSISIAAASIIAKVARDRYMTEMASVYPEYGFEKHKGYGTAAHLSALRRHGASPLHRRSFQPVAEVVSQPSLF